MLSCSTCWNSGRHTEGVAMLEEILDLGFQNVELGHGIRLLLIEGILKMFEAGRVQFHQRCTISVRCRPRSPRASPDCYQFTSPRTGSATGRVRHTLQTIDFAKRLGAKFVVLHLGSRADRRLHA